MPINYEHPRRGKPQADSTPPLQAPSIGQDSRGASSRVAGIPHLFPDWYRSILAAGDRPDSSDNMLALIERTAVMITVGAAQPWLADDQAALTEFHDRFDGGGQDENRVLHVPDDMIDFLSAWSPSVHDQLRALVNVKLPLHLSQYLANNPDRLPMMDEWDTEPDEQPQPPAPASVAPRSRPALTGSGSYLEQLALAAPINFDTAKPDWAGVHEVVRAAGYDPSEAIAATWCSFGKMNIEALVDATQLTILFPTGIVSTLGKRKMLTGGMKCDMVPFSICRGFGADDHTDARGFGKYCIEFVGAGNILLGRLQWQWKGKRFRDNRGEIMAVAEERDRFLAAVGHLLD
jgi:hypothetical protein